ncbi:MAG: hypothetical protein IT559_00195 [Alphaproteobacteria bacterium]|nr:hypothetical protein [Alphaproteobacteria bacterium]
MSVRSAGGEQTLADLFHEIRRARFYIFTGASFGVFAAFVLMLLAVPHGGAQMIIAPAVAMEAVVSPQKFTGSFVHNELENQNFERFQTVVSGAAVASLLLRNDEIINGLSGDKNWKFSAPRKIRTPGEMAAYIKRRVVFEPVGETAMRRMRYTHPDPQFAAAFLQRLHGVADGLIRYDTRNAVSGRVAYLQKALAESRNPEHRRALADLLLEQERLRMLVLIDRAYAASVVEPSFTVAGVVWPDPVLVFSVFSCVGALMGFVVFAVRQPVSQPVVATRNPEAAAALKSRLSGLRRRAEDAGQDNYNRRRGLPADAAE